MISIATMGKFWPQAGHGVLSDGGKYGIDSQYSDFNFQQKIVKPKNPSIEVLNITIEENPFIEIDICGENNA